MDVQAMHTAYSNYASANVFADSVSVAGLADTEVPMYNAAFEPEPGAKRHAACDECRKRKLKCSGEPTDCARCVKQNLTCHYSKQAVMGRPRKKKKTSEDAEAVEAHPPKPSMEQAIQPIVPDYTVPKARAEFEGLCTGPVTQYIRSKNPAPPPPFVTQGSLYEHPGSFMATRSDSTPPTDSPLTPILSQREAAEAAYPKDFASWPDYSTMTMLPQIVQDNQQDPYSSSEHSHSVDAMESIHNLSTTPACACLPNLYLTLSSLSTLASFPVSIHTIESLQTAHRTAKSVLYCHICPTKFQSGVQNVMLSGTLLTVLADQWLRVQKATAEELRSGFAQPRANSMAEEPPLTDLQSLEWRTFAYHLLRANVFGYKVTPCPPSDQLSTEFFPDSTLPADQRIEACRHLMSINSSASIPTLQDLIDAMERRQSCWHGKIPDTGEFPKHMSKKALQEYMQGMTPEQLREVEIDANGYLCLRIVQSARSVLKILDKSEPTL